MNLVAKNHGNGHEAKPQDELGSNAVDLALHRASNGTLNRRATIWLCAPGVAPAPEDFDACRGRKRLLLFAASFMQTVHANGQAPFAEDDGGGARKTLLSMSNLLRMDFESANIITTHPSTATGLPITSSTHSYLQIEMSTLDRHSNRAGYPAAFSIAHQLFCDCQRDLS